MNMEIKGKLKTGEAVYTDKNGDYWVEKDYRYLVYPTKEELEEIESIEGERYE